MKFNIVSKKHGTHEVLIDDDDAQLFHIYKWYLYTTNRHTGIYVVSKRNKKYIRLHREIMKPKKGELVDHINGNPLDNRKCNLRICDSHTNNANAKKRRNARTSKYKGVHYSYVSKKIYSPNSG